MAVSVHVEPTMPRSTVEAMMRSISETSPTVQKIREENWRTCAAWKDDRGWFCDADNYEDAIVALEDEIKRLREENETLRGEIAKLRGALVMPDQGSV